MFFKNEETFKRVRDSGAITPKRIAELYGMNEEDVMAFTFFDPAGALKITLKRWVSAAAPGDTDVFGAQQHVPLMLLTVELKE